MRTGGEAPQGGGCMARISIKSYEPEFSVRVRLQWRERFQDDQCRLLRDRYSEGVMRLSDVSGRTATFTAPADMQLSKYLRLGLDRTAFFQILVQTVNVLRWVNRQRLPIANLELNTEHVFINQHTRELFFLYIPAESEEVRGNLRAFLEQLIFDSSFRTRAEADDKQELAKLLESSGSITTHLLETYVRGSCPEAAAQIAAGELASGPRISDSKSEYLRQMSLRRDAERCDAAPAAPRARAGTDLYYSRSDSLVSEPFGAEDGTTLLDETDGTVLLDDAEEDAGTIVIDTGGTVVLAQEALEHPRLYRRKTGAEIVVDKPVFRIGKEEGYVDYLIPDNPAVSRSHADIISRDGSYYIYDNNSTNKTYVNNIMIPALKNVKLEDGCLIRLADEEFEFKTTDS